MPARAARFIQWPDPDLNPHFFLKPTLTYYGVAVSYLVAYPFVRLAGFAPSYAAYLAHVPLLTFIGRLFTAAQAIGTVAALRFAVGGAFGWRAGILGALLLAVVPFHAAIAHYINVDVPLVLFSVLALGASLRYLRSMRRRDLVAGGLFAGLAASAKYPGAILCITVTVAYLLAPRRRPFVDLAAAGLASVVAFLATSPFVVLAFREFSTGIGSEAGHMRGLHPGYDLFVDGWLFHPLVYQVVAQWPLCMSWPLYALGLAGVSWAVRRRGDVRNRLVLLGYVVPWVAVVGTATVSFPRYAIPVLVGLVVLASAWLDEGFRVRPKAVRVALVGVLVASVGYAGWMSLTLAMKLEPQSAELAAGWLAKHAPDGSRVAVAIFFPNLPLDRSRLEVRQVQSVPDWSDAMGWANYVVVSSEYELALERAETPRFAQRAFLERLRVANEWRLVAEFRPPPFLNEDAYAALDPYFHNHFHAHAIEVFARTTDLRTGS
ncbi:MAG: glycosyltransferase family 39 protein [Deltaproteobacteria bacterium]|nr:glycosyltransferase family 39 protein [Deltaproteobacteria bacterium]